MVCPGGLWLCEGSGGCRGDFELEISIGGKEGESYTEFIHTHMQFICQE